MAALSADYELITLWEHEDKQAALAAHGRGVRALATRGDLGADAALINSLPDLEFIACYGVGTDGIDRSATRPRGIRISNTPDVLNDDVADLAFALMLAVTRNIVGGDAFVRSGSWEKNTAPLETKLTGKRLGIIGLGRIGKAIAKRAAAFDMTTAYYGRNEQTDTGLTYYNTLTGLAANSDILVAIVPGGAETAGIVNADVFRALGPHGYFINVARGTVANESDLLHALENKVIKGAGLDVYLNEPKIDHRFRKLDNVVLQPHQGSATHETRGAMGQLVRDNLAAFFAGKPLLTETA
jgi:lactate dehydrogenase-like 2-hydroxyacid dehydrogenase